MFLLQTGNAEPDILLELLKLVIPQTLVGVGGWTGIALILVALERRYRLATRILDVLIPRLNGVKRKTDEYKAVPAPSPYDDPMKALTKVIAAQQIEKDKLEDDFRVLTVDHADLLESQSALVAANGALDAQIAALKTKIKSLESERDGLQLEVAALMVARKPSEPAAFVEAGDDEDTAELKGKGDSKP